MNSKNIFTDEELLSLLENKYSLYEICNKLKVSRTTVCRRMKLLGVSTFDYKLDTHVFDVIDTEEKAYWLGFLFADGYISSKSTQIGLCLSSVDRNHLEKFIKIFKYRKEHITDTVAKCNGKEFKCCKWSLKNTHLHTTLNNLGCVPNKSLILKFPKKEIFKNEDLIYNFIRGYVDGDGCLWLNQKGKLTIEIMGTKEFLEGILEYFPNKMTLGHKDKRRPDSNTYRLIGCASNALNICSKLYDNASVYLERKYLKYKTAVSNSNI